MKCHVQTIWKSPTLTLLAIMLNVFEARPEIIMPQTFAIILFLDSFEMLLLFPNPLLLFSHYSQQMKSTFYCSIRQHRLAGWSPAVI